jgi:hypothetical protein
LLEFWGKERKWLGLFLDIVCVSKLFEGGDGGNGCVTMDERINGRGRLCETKSERNEKYFVLGLTVNV